MATSLIKKCKRLKSKKILKFFTIAFIIVLNIGSVFAQPVLIPAIPASNQYPITFTSVGQNQLILRFDSQVSATPSVWLVTGWSITGTTATITSVASNLNQIQISLSGAITYTQRQNVQLSYNGTGNTPIAAFSNVAAVNNYLVSCNDFNISSINLDNSNVVCQTVTITATGNIVVPSVARNSIYFNETNGVRINFVWLLSPLTNQTIDFSGSETFPGSGIFTVNRVYNYPFIDDCQISPYLYIMHYWNIGDYMYSNDPEGDSRLRCNDAAYIIQEVFPTFCEDNIRSGVLALNEPVEGREYCIGEDIPGVQFINGTLLNCRMTAPAPYGPLTQEEANRGTRWVRFVYGTHSAAGIPNVFVDIGGVMTQVTDGDGNVLIVNGVIGEVQEYTSPQDVAQGLSERIYHTGNYDPDQVGDVFGVTMQMWNQCNPYILDVFTGDPINDPVEIYNDLILVSGPIADAGDDFSICAGNTTGPLDGQIFLAADRGVWSTVTGTGLFNNPSTLNTFYTPSTDDISAHGVWLILTAIDDGALTCPEHKDSVYVTIDPIPALPVVQISAGDADATFCDDGGTTSVTLRSSVVSPDLVYRWERNNVLVPGETSRTIVLDDWTEAGNYSVTIYGNTANHCPIESAQFPVVIGRPVTASISTANGTICSNSTFSISAATTGPVTSRLWTSTGTGSFAPNNNNNTVYTPGASDAGNTITITFTAYTNLPCGSDFDQITLTIVPAPIANAGINAATCQGSPYTVNDASASNYSTLVWSHNGSGSLSGATGLTPVYTPGAGDIGGTVTLTLTVNGNSPCLQVVRNKLLYVDRTPTATVGARQDICNTTTASLVGNTSTTDLLNSAYGEWTFINNLVWQETFSESPDYSTSGTQWTTSGITPDADTYFRTEGRRIVGRDLDAVAVWQSELIPINTVSPVKIMVLLQSAGSLEGTDYIDVFYRLNNGSEISFTTNGHNTGVFADRIASVSGLSGNNVRIVIRARNSANDEYYYIDNIEVRQVPVGVEPSITTRTVPNSSVTGLWPGDNLFRWSVFSQHNGCDSVSSVYIIRRFLPPTTSNAGPDDDVCENVTTYTLAGNVPTVGTGTWTTTGGATITTPGSATSGVTGLAVGNNDFTWTISNGTCPVSADVVTIFRNSPVSPGTISADQQICENETPVAFTGSAASGGDGSTYTYSWQYSTTSNGGPWTTIPATNTTGYSPAALTTTTWYRRLVSSGDAGCLTQQNVPTTNVIQIFVEPELLPGSISGNQDICFGDSPVAFVSDAPASGGSAPTYLWYHKLGAGVWAPLVGETNSTYTALNNLVVGTHYYYRLATSSTGYCGPEQTNEVNIVVNPGPTSEDWLIAGDPTKCENESITLTYPAVTDATQYAWDFSWLPATVDATTATPTITIDLSTHTFTSPFEDVTINAAGVNGCNNDPTPGSGDYPWSAAHNLSVYRNPNANAGSGGNECDYTFTLNATASVGTGTWTMTSGTGTANYLPNANTPGATVTVSQYGTKEFTWTEVNGTCSDNDAVTVNFYQQPVANAGSGGNECDYTFTLNATASVGTGTWTMTSGTGTANYLPNANTPGATVTVSQYGTKEFTWTEVNGTCSDNDAVTVNFYQQPVANAGSGGNECDYTFTLNATASVGTGTWTMTSGTGTANFSPNENTPGATVTVSQYGTKEFTWTEVNGTCSDNDAVTVNFYQQPVANAGSGGNECDFTFALNATASVGTGTWTMTSGTGTANYLPNANTPGATVTVSQYGTKEFTWTEVNGTCSDNDAVTVNFYQQPVANAGSGGNECDQDFVLNATASVGTGTWTMTSGTGTANFSPNENTPGATVTVSQYGTKEFTWTEVNGTCSDNDAVTVNFYQQPVANAGSGGNECDFTFALNATASVGTGTWTMTSGTGTANYLPNANTPGATVTVSQYGTKEFTWTEVNGTCSDNDAVTVNFYQQPVANAGSGGNECDQDFVLNATASVGTGTWTMTSGTGTANYLPNANTPGATVTVSQYGTKEFTWTEVNGTCSDNESVSITFFEAPTVSVTPVADVCRDINLAVIPISGNFGGGASSATWSIITGGGSLQNITTVGTAVSAEYLPIYSDITAGAVTLRLTTDDPTGPCTSVFANLIINIDEAVYVVIDQAPTVFIAEGGSAVLTSTISGAGGTVTTGVWTEEGALTGGTFTPNNTTNNITFTPTAAQEAVGSVVLRLTSLDPGTSCGPEYAEVTILIGANPIADAGDDIEDCEPADGLLHLSGWAKASAGDANWSVITGAGTVISQTKTWSVPQSVPHDEDDSLFVEAVYQLAVADYGAPSTGSTFQFRLTTDDPDGAGPVIFDTDDMQYTVHWGPHTPAIGGGGKGSMCVDTYGQFYSVPLKPGNTYVWTVEVLTGGGVEGPLGDYDIVGGGTGFNFIAIDWIKEGTYNLKVTETTYLSDLVTPCVGTTVVKPIGVYLAPVVSAGSNATICIGATYNLTSTVTSGSGSYLYEWSPTIGLSAFNIPNPVVTGTFTGPVTYTLKVTDLVSGCESVSSDVIITSNPLPIIYTLSGPSYYCAGAVTGVTLTLNNSESDVLYQLKNGAVDVGLPVLGSTGNPVTWTDNFNGSYFVEAVRNAIPACARTMAGVVNVSANPPVTMPSHSVVDVKCFGTNGGQISITPGGGTAPYTYLWTGPGAFSSTNEDITGLYAGVYNVTITDSRGCTYNSGPITVAQPDQLVLSSVLETQAVTCYGGSDGEAEVIVDPATGTAPYNYQWYYDASFSSPVGNASATTSTLSGVPAATYYILVTDANLCTVNGSTTVTQPTQITGSGAVTTVVSCNGVSDAVITITASGGSGTLEYDMNGLNAWQGNVFSGLGAGTYTFRVRDVMAPACIVSIPDVVITQPNILTITGNVTSNYNGSQISCPTATDGIITVSGAGGTAPYTYNLDGGAYQAGTAFGTLGAATYLMGIRDAHGCTATVNVTITAPTPISGTATATSDFTGFDVSCNGAADGIITVTASDGTGTLRYSLDGGAFQLSNVFTGLSQGTYDITVRDANLCTFNINNVPVTEPTAIVASAIVTSDYNGRDISCNGQSDGEVTASAVGGTGVYTYQWFYNAALSSAVPGGNLAILAGQPAGTYYVLVTDENGCTATTSVTINPTPLLVITKTANVLLSCNADNDATGTFTITGGTLPYIISEDVNSSGATTVITATDVSFTNGGAGVVTITVTDPNGCSETSTITITEPLPITASAAVTSNYNGSDVSCFGSSNGRISVTASGGTGALGYVLNEIPGNTTGAITGVFTGLPSGPYTVTVTDVNGCNVTTASVTINDPPQVTAVAAITSDYNGSEVSCNGAADGIITVTAGGGTGLLSYTLMEMPGNNTGVSSGVFTGVPAGSYTVRVTDVNGCNVITPAVVIDNPLSVTGSALVTSNYNGSTISCNGASDGEITVTASGGTGALTYVLNQDPGNLTGAASGVFTGVSAGIYTVNVRDLNGCNINTAAVMLTNPTAVSGTALVTSNYNGSQVRCNGSSDGVITVSAFGGTGALSYELVQDPLNVTGATTGVFTGLTAGIYTVTVSDLNGCNITTSPVTINNPTVITASASITSNYNGSEVSCFGASDGRITVTASGGTGTLTYLLVEMPLNITGANTGIFSGVPSGSYTVTVTDLNSCNTTTAAVVIDDPPAVTAVAAITSDYNGSDVSCNGSVDGVITVTAGGGTGALIYTLIESPGNLTGATTGIFTSVAAGSYTIKVTDVNGCNVTTLPVVLFNPSSVTASGVVTSDYNGSDVTCFGDSDGEITISAAGGTGTLAYVLNQVPLNVTGAVSGVFTDLTAGTYTVTVTDENGCNATTANIIVSNPPAVSGTISVTSNFNGSHIRCNGDANGQITVIGSGGTGTLSYVLVEDPLNVTGVTTGVFTGLIAGPYSVLITDDNGCNTTTSVVTVNEPAVVTASAAVTSNYNGSDVSCFGSSNGRISVTASGGTGALGYVLNEIPGNTTGAITGVFTGLPSGPYTVTVTDVNGCNVTTASVTINDPPQVTAVAAITSDYNGSEVSCNGAADGIITVTAGGGTGLLSYTLMEMPGNNTGVSSGVFTGVPAGSYTVRVTDVNGCNVITPAVVIDNPLSVTGSALVTSNYNGSTISCNGASDGEITVTASGGTGALTYVLNQDPGNLTGAASGVFTGVSAGIYTVNVRDLNGCNINTAAVMLTNPTAVSGTALVTSNYNGSQVRCNGSSDGVITVSAFGGTGALSYELVQDPLNVTGATTGVFTGLTAGIYTVTVSDLNGCNITTSPVTINNPTVITASASITSNYNGSEVSCFGASDGRITVTASGGTGTLTYLLVEMPLNITGANTGIFSGVPSGSYTVTVTDLNSCNTTTAAVVIDDPPAVTAVAAITSDYNGSDVSCNGSVDGVITVTAGGGTGALIYTLIESPGNLTGATTGIFTSVAAGSYTIKVTDVNGCNVTTLPVVLFNPSSVTASGVVTSDYNGSDVTCFGDSDGEITISAAGGTGTLSYVLNQVPLNVTGAASGVFTGLTAGTYTVTVTDENGCNVTTANIILSNPPAVSGTISVTSNFNGSHIRCNGDANGQITVIGSGGTGTLSYVLVEDPLNVTGVTTGVFTGLIAGPYSVLITDDNGCNTTTSVVTVNEPAVVTASAAVTSNYNGSDVSCFGSSNGRISVTASGGTGALGYVLNEIPGNTTGAITGVFTGLPSGPYTVTVTDVNGCNVTTASVTINDPPALTLAVNVISNYNGSDISCNGASDGRAQAIVGGGTGIYFYNWYSDAALTVPIGQFVSTAINLAAGTYWVRVTDINGCIIVDNVTLTQPVALVATETAKTNVGCFGGSTGSVTVEVTAGTGIAPYTYSINGGSSWQGTGTFINLPAGNYIVLSRDINLCSFPVNVTITQPTPLVAGIITKTNVSCNGLSDGSVTVEATAGSGTSPYQYSIDGGTNWFASGTFSGLAMGSYNVTVEDAHNCSVVIPVSITEPAVLELNPTSDVVLDCAGDTDGTGTFYAQGGTMPYTFTPIFNSAGASYAAPNLNSQTIFNAGAGTVTFRVTDAHGCTQVASIVFSEPAPLVPGVIGLPDVVCYGGDPDLIFEVVPASGGSGAYAYQWLMSGNVGGPFTNIPSANNATYDPPLGAVQTTYYRRQVSVGSCIPEYTNIIEVKVNPLPSATLSGGGTICPGESSILKVTMTVGTGPFDVDIDDGGAGITRSGYVSGTDIIVTPGVTTTYTLAHVRDANGCEVTAPSGNLSGEAKVILRDPPVITSSPADVEKCEFNLVTFNVIATGTDLSYQWEVYNGSSWTDVIDGGVYFGATQPSLMAFSISRTMNNYRYRVSVSGCSSVVFSGEATLTVNTAPEFLKQPSDTTICKDESAFMKVEAQGTNITYQWYVNDGTGFDIVTDDANFSGSDTETLTISDAPVSFNNYLFRVRISGTCGAPIYSSFGVLHVTNPPTTTSDPGDKVICEGAGTTLIAGGYGYNEMFWQANDGAGWDKVIDGVNYLGAGSPQLVIQDAPVGLTGYQYRLALVGDCDTTFTDYATLVVNLSPVVDFSGIDPVAACGNVPIVIDGNPTGGSGTYTQHLWTGEVGPLNNYLIQAPTFNSQISGPYNLTYKVTDSNGCTASDNIVINVDSPSADFIQDINNGCSPLSVTFTKNMTGISKFWWDFDDGSPIDSVNTSPVHQFTNANASSIEYYDVKLTVQSPGGCLDSFTSMITVYPAVDASFTASTIIVCSGSSISFTALSGASKYFWEYGDGASGYSTNTSSHLYTNFTTEPVVHTVRLTTTSFYNCTDVQTVDITVMPVPIPQFSADPPTQIYDIAGNPVDFTNETNDGTWSWLWRFGDGATSTDQDPSHTYTDLGEYSVTLIVNNANCSDSITHTVSVLPLPPVANFDSIPSGCEPLNITINNTSLNTDAPGTTYRWDFGDGSISTARNPTYTYFDPGIYRVELIVTGPGGVTSKSQVVNAYPSPKAYFEVAPLFVFVNDEKVRCFNLSQGADSYLWEFGDGDTSKVKEPFHKYMESGVFDITLWAYSDNGCSDKFVLSPGVTVEPAGEVRFSTVFTPNLDGPIDRTDLPTGGVEIDQFFFPPIRDKVINYKLQVFNRLGVLIFESHDINIPWNGYYKGQLCQQGVYIWYVEGKYANGQPFKKVGDVTLLH